MEDGAQVAPLPSTAEPEPISRPSSVSTQDSVAQGLSNSLSGLSAIIKSVAEASSPQQRSVLEDSGHCPEGNWRNRGLGVGGQASDVESRPQVMHRGNKPCGRVLCRFWPICILKHLALSCHGADIIFRPIAIAPAMYQAGTSPASTAPAPGGNLVSRSLDLLSVGRSTLRWRCQSQVLIKAPLSIGSRAAKFWWGRLSKPALASQSVIARPNSVS